MFNFAQDVKLFCKPYGKGKFRHKEIMKIGERGRMTFTYKQWKGHQNISRHV